MSGIVQGVGDLLGSIFEIFKGIIDTILGAFQSVLSLFAGLIQNIMGAFEGIVGFILGNIFILGTLAAAYFAFAYYRGRQGKPIAGSKKVT